MSEEQRLIRGIAKSNTTAGDQFTTSGPI